MIKLRSVELQVPDAEAATVFLRDTWRLRVVSRIGPTAFLRGRGSDPYLIAITEATEPAIRSVTFAAKETAIEELRKRARDSSYAWSDIDAAHEPGRGRGVQVVGPESQTFRFLTDERDAGSCDQMTVGSAPTGADMPIQLTHVVINVVDLRRCEEFAASVIGFKISDRTKIMTFLRCNRKHHCIAYAPTTVSSLNHIAFEMQDTDAVMRGIGRLRDAGVPCAWGPGRHGPGNNVFAYFVAPFGGVIEYTSEVSEVEETHTAGGPEDWQWPPGRIDQWGISTKDVKSIGAAEKRFRFLATR